MRNVSRILTSFLVIVFAGSAFAQSPVIEVRDLALPAKGWGEKKIGFKAFNHDEYVRFIVVKSKLEFEGLCAKGVSESRYCAYVEPGIWFLMEPSVTIPGNYGTASISLEFYDVVDTLDTVLPDQKFLDTAFTVEIEMPPSARPWLEKATAFPPRVDEHPYFDNQFVRMMYAMIAEGKSLSEIAAITGSDPDFVKANLRTMAGQRYLTMEDSVAVATFPIILTDEAEQVMDLVDATAASLTSVLTNNYSGYRGALDSLIEAGVLAGDSNDVLGPERLLFHPYIVLSAVLLWNELGTRFITDGNPFDLYAGTDICNANIVKFMYATPSDAKYRGHHFYTTMSDRRSGRILFAGHLPEIECEGNFPAQPGVASKAMWKYASDDRADHYIYNPTAAQPVLDVLKADADQVIQTALVVLEKMATGRGREQVSKGYRYWFWNLVASKTLDSLIEQKVVEPDGKDNYILEIRGD